LGEQVLHSAQKLRLDGLGRQIALVADLDDLGAVQDGRALSAL
jgi:hypothetical protein